MGGYLRRRGVLFVYGSFVCLLVLLVGVTGKITRDDEVMKWRVVILISDEREGERRES